MRLGPALMALAVLGFVAGLVPLVLALATEGGHQRELIAITGPVIGWAFIGTGVYAWARQPDNRLGALMTAVGFSSCLAGLRVSTEPWVFIVGLLFITSQWALLFHMLLAFPRGVVETGFERLLVAAMYFSSVVVHPVMTLFHDTTRQGFPENPLLIGDGTDLSDLTRVRFWFTLGLLVALTVILAQRWSAQRGAPRKALAPVFVSGGLVMALLGVWYAALLAGVGQDVIDGLEDARYVVLATVPFAFLAGLIRTRVAEASAVSQVVARLGDPALRRRGVCHAMDEALRGTSLEIAYRDEDGTYANCAGDRVDIPPADPRRDAVSLEAGGEPVAVLTHDATREDERELVRTVAAAATLALENERLADELRAKVEELSASRARIVESGDATRRRLERDLHDGAQQRLVSLALSLRILSNRLDGNTEAMRELESARTELDHAMDELRELARGIHPSLLSDRGLDAAVESLAHRAPLPVELELSPGDRLPERVESASYFVVSEALTNVAKYARATHASVNVTRDNGRVLVEVSDDGVGGADPGNGTGLRGLLDRVSSLGGSLEVDSRPGSGTTVRAEIPCE
ncbi:MAG TPA: sensor histidine kinase [Thermoleophilaceae bacterium]|nr:sensor histidine kinase [Thermoleophilaceae bacterium]